MNKGDQVEVISKQSGQIFLGDKCFVFDNIGTKSVILIDRETGDKFTFDNSVYEVRPFKIQVGDVLELVDCNRDRVKVLHLYNGNKLTVQRINENNKYTIRINDFIFRKIHTNGVKTTYSDATVTIAGQKFNGTIVNNHSTGSIIFKQSKIKGEVVKLNKVKPIYKLIKLQKQ